MPLDYFLTENRLTDRPDDMTAITRSGVSIDENGLIDRILPKGTSLTRTDVKAVFNAANEAIAEGAERGETYILPLMNISFSIVGRFFNKIGDIHQKYSRMFIRQPRTVM